MSHTVIEERFNIAQRDDQDKLEEGLIKTQEGNYILFTQYGVILNDKWHKICKMEKQKKLDDKLLLIDNNNYVDLKNIPVVTSAPEKKYDAGETPCFVATAVYADPNAPQIAVLREIRDNVLTRHEVGRAFIKFYYSGKGEQAANFIRDTIPGVIPTMRKGLDFLVAYYTQKKNTQDKKE
jgi:hypothetical protein